MSWAAGRKTSRIEDRAYSLLGLFNINMPLLYGEGEKAFIRLQEEIISNLNDQSIFAWTGRSLGTLASSPDVFHASAGIMPLKWWNLARPVTMTSFGINLNTQIFHHNGKSSAILYCQQSDQPNSVLAMEVEMFTKGQPLHTNHNQLLNVSLVDLIGLNRENVVLVKDEQQFWDGFDWRNWSWSFIFDVSKIQMWYEIRVCAEPGGYSEDGKLFFVNCDTYGSGGIILRPKHFGWPAFAVAVSDGLELGGDWPNKKGLQPALLVLKFQDDNMIGNPDQIVLHLMHEAANKAEECRQKAKVPQPLWFSSISEQEVLIIEHTNSQLMDYPIALVKLEVVSLESSHGRERHEEVKGRLETWQRDGNELI
jgi:hypothetical protein